MTDTTIDQTLAGAFAALRAVPKATIQRSSLIDAALLLNTLPNSDLAALRAQIAERLSPQLSPAWIAKGDLFTVFLTLTALWNHDPTYVSGNHLACAIQRLVACEAAVGGPYYSNGTVEIMANLQIAAFVRLVAKPLPNVDAFFDRIIKAEQLADTSLYASYLFATLYNYQITQHPQSSTVRRAIALVAPTPCVTATTQQQVTALCHEQLSTGFWAGEPLIGDHRSKLVTTALLIAILIQYRQSTNAQTTSLTLQQRHQSVILATRQLFDGYSEPLRSSTLAAIEKICHAYQGYEITLLSTFFARALKNPVGLTRHQYTMLGAASVCGWIAYTIYDDFLDNQGKPDRLPVANTAMRASLNCFNKAMPGQKQFQRYIAATFDRMDEANAWEVAHCRFVVQDGMVHIAQIPQYGKRAILAKRSFAHALGPIAVFMQQPHATPSTIRHIETAFRHYLIAKQLGDDMHDWHDDMQAGQASYVVTTILRSMRMQPGTYHLSDLLPKMHRQFRRTTMPHICKLALLHVDLAHQGFANGSLVRAADDIYTLLDDLEHSLESSLDQYEKAQHFINADRRFTSESVTIEQI